MKISCLLLYFLLILPLAAEPLVLASKTVSPEIVLAPQAGDWEKRAADELVRCLSEMTGAQAVKTEKSKSSGPRIVVGSLALEASPKLRDALNKVVNKKPRFRCDAVALLREGNTVYLAGSNEMSHYFAAVALLNRFGCRWYMPGEFGECLPAQESVQVDELAYTHASPFEVRTYWVSWMGDRTGYEEFCYRNFYNLERPEGGGSHALDKYLKELPKDAALTDPSTAIHVAEKLRAKYAQGEPLSLGISDGIQGGRSTQDADVSGRIEDKYFATTAWADVIAVFYNIVCSKLKEWEPNGSSEIAFLAYTNVTLPPQRVSNLVEPLICYLAPIDIDPNHAMNDPRSPARMDYRGVVESWTRVMDGRVVIYDYDQSMLVWRPVPNPSHQVVERDVKIYRDIGILGFATESRHAFSTTFLNLHFRGQLYWDPEYSVDVGLKEFYPKFYGTAAPWMEKYWTEIFEAWEKTEVTEHEYMAMTAIYTPELEQRLEQSVQSLPDENKADERVRFTLLGFDFLKAYTKMWRAVATEGDFKHALALGRKATSIREQLLSMSPQFDTPAARIKAKGPAWLPGEIEQYERLAQLPEKSMTPLKWKFRQDAHDHGVWRNWAREAGGPEWKDARTDLYLQGQDVLEGLPENPGGFAWYFTELEVPSGTNRLMFPGLFNEAWLYVDDQLLAHREQKELWWKNDYTFEWDVDLGGLPPGRHRFALRVPVTEHFAGMFRRPFLYKGTEPKEQNAPK